MSLDDGHQKIRTPPGQPVEMEIDFVQRKNKYYFHYLFRESQEHINRSYANQSISGMVPDELDIKGQNYFFLGKHLAAVLRKDTTLRDHSFSTRIPFVQN